MDEKLWEAKVRLRSLDRWIAAGLAIAFFSITKLHASTITTVAAVSNGFLSDPYVATDIGYRLRQDGGPAATAALGGGPQQSCIRLCGDWSLLAVASAGYGDLHAYATAALGSYYSGEGPFLVPPYNNPLSYPSLAVDRIQSGAGVEADDVLSVSNGAQLVLSYRIDGVQAGPIESIPYGYVNYATSIEADFSVIGFANPGGGCSRTLGSGVTFVTCTIGFDPNTPFALRTNLDANVSVDVPWGYFGPTNTGVNNFWTSDYSNTASLISTEILDRNGRPVDATITSESGFDYANPNPVNSTVPEPGTLPELIVGAALLAGAYLRRRAL
jgi:hypothetical protein